MPRLRSVLLVAVWTAACGTSTTATGGGDPNADGGTPHVPQVPRVAGGDLCNDPPADAATSKMRARSCALGDDARSFVRGAPYTKVLVEIGATKSARPSQAAIVHLTVVMRDLLDKPGGVTVVVDPPIADVGHAMTLAEVATIEEASRVHYSGGDTAVFYYLVVSEASTDDTADAQVLGYAYRPSSMVVFQKSIFADSGGLAQPTRDTVESTVVAHEFGHILGLVNAGTAMQSPHEDTAHPKHDTNTGCIMYWANNSSALVANLVSGGVVPDFDPACRADVAALKQ